MGSVVLPRQGRCFSLALNGLQSANAALAAQGPLLLGQRVIPDLLSQSVITEADTRTVSCDCFVEKSEPMLSV